MKDLFPGHYRPSQDDFEQLWQASTFVLDANILLGLYRLPQQTSEQFLDILDSISDRIWVPYYAAMEYQVNRLGVIAEQKGKFSEVRSVVENAKSNLLSELSKLRLKKRHSTIDPDPLVAEIGESIERFLQNLEELDKAHEMLTGEDPIRTRIDQILDGRIGDPPKSQADLDRIYVEGEIRYERQVPPGYMDSEKPDDDVNSLFYSDIIFKKKFGDLLIWKEILDFAVINKPASVILVTDDEKEDWWLLSSRSGNRVISPRPELVAEFKKYSGADSRFYMYNSEQFLKWSRRYLQSEFSDDLIAQVQDIKQVFSSAGGDSDLVRAPGQAIEHAVIVWLMSAHPGSVIVGGDSTDEFDFVHFNERDERTGYIVKSLSGRSLYGKLTVLSQHMIALRSAILASAIDKGVLVYIVPDDDSALSSAYSRARSFLPYPDYLSVVIGIVRKINPRVYVDDDDPESGYEFEPRYFVSSSEAD